ncbi:MAG TPA: amidohydrolase [Flammeovirgaceae bacterium]|nr:amidohydrolase [Flammeovirgaceae bacterium]
MRTCFLLPLLFTIAGHSAIAQAYKKQIISNLDKKQQEYADMAMQIWQYAEVGYQEVKSSKLLQDKLREAGFTVEAGVAGIPTSFVASYGSGKPVIGLLAEFDALPGLSQAAVTKRQPIVQEGPGHACGHHLFGVASVAAAIEAKEWLARSGHSGTIRLYGTPAEEGGAGKVYMVRAGLFDDVDAVLHWHPADRNSASPTSSLANKSAKFRFYGNASHAAAAPERGRSALDAVEAMDFMTNLMREHVPDKTRIHYIITKGGTAPNIVPEFAEVFYYVRHPQMSEVKNIFDRLVKIAEGAALGTGTRMEYEVIHGVYNLLPNEPLARVMYHNLQYVGGVQYNEEEKAFAEKIQATYKTEQPLSSAAEIMPFKGPARPFGSTDVGDISWLVPTAGMSAATWVPGTSAHSWQAVAAGGTTIGSKGMLVAAKTLALTAVELFNSPKVLQEAKAQLEHLRGPDFHYEAMLGDRPPPLDYRK